jgi:hypothetical protein
MGRTLTACRTGLSVAAAVALLSACGGSDGNDAASSSSAESSAPQADSAFCREASTIQERIDATLSARSDSSALPQALQQAANDIRNIEPPAEIAEDWEALAGGLEQIAEAFGSIDFNDPSALPSFQEQMGQLQTELGTASTNVRTYLADECGIEFEPTQSASPTS